MKKNVLVFTYDFPYPTTSGGKIRAYNLIKHGLKNYNVHLFSFTRGAVDEEQKKEIFDIGVKTIYLFQRRKLFDIRNISFFSKSSIFKKLYWDSEIDNFLFDFIHKQKIDVLLCESFYTGYYLSGKIRKDGVKKIFGTENIEHKIYQDYVEQGRVGFFKNIFQSEVDKIKTEEIQAINSADLIFAISNLEQKQLGLMAKSARVKVVENGVDVKAFSYDWTKRATKKLLFVGNFSYFPNKQAIMYFYRDVFKKIKDKSVSLKIIGANSSKLSIDDDRVITSSYVDDIHKEYTRADVFVFPLKIGGGSNLKVIEAMASGVPVIGFAQRLEGLSVVAGVHFIEARDSVSFMSGVENLLSDSALASRISKNAREYIEKNYSWQIIGQKLEKIINDL